MTQATCSFCPHSSERIMSLSKLVIRRKNFLRLPRVCRGLRAEFSEPGPSAWKEEAQDEADALSWCSLR